MFGLWDVIVWGGVTIERRFVARFFPEDLPDCRLPTDEEMEVYHARK